MNGALAFVIIVTLWLGASVLVCWLAGRFIRVGMVELQPQRHVAEDSARRTEL